MKRPAGLGAVVVTTAALLMGLGLPSAQGYAPATGPSVISGESLSASSALPPRNLETIKSRLIGSLAQIFCGTRAGTAWSIDIALSAADKRKGYRSYLVTSYENVRRCLGSDDVRLIELRYLGSESTGFVWAWDEESNLAGILTTVDIPKLAWTGVTKPIGGQWVGVIGNPSSRDASVATGSVIDVTLRDLRAELSVPPSMSGGPVFDNRGQVVGVATATVPNEATYIPGSPLYCREIVKCNNPLGIWLTATVPGAPRSVTLKPGVASLRVSWQVPQSDGGAEITSYMAVATPGGRSCVSNLLTCTITGLANGTAYRVTVTATNSVGQGPASATAGPAKPLLQVPASPTSVQATAGKRSVSVAWVAPRDSEVTYYEVRVKGAPAWSSAGTRTSAKISRLRPGRAVTVEVRACNSAGCGPVALAGPVTPR